MAKRKRDKRPPGRPSGYSLKVGDLICALLAEGKSLRTICSLDRMPRLSTVLLWVVKGERGDETYKPFSEQYAHAREAQMEALLDEVVEISDNDSKDFAFRESEDSEGKGAKLCIIQDKSIGTNSESKPASSTPRRCTAESSATKSQQK